MKIEYSKEDDALYITLKEADVADTDELTEDIIIDYVMEATSQVQKFLMHHSMLTWKASAYPTTLKYKKRQKQFGRVVKHDHIVNCVRRHYTNKEKNDATATTIFF